MRRSRMIGTNIEDNGDIFDNDVPIDTHDETDADETITDETIADETIADVPEQRKARHTQPTRSHR